MSDSNAPAHMAHEEAFAELGALALGALDRATGTAVESHAQTCTICAGELAALRDALAALPAAVPGTSLDRDRSRDIKSRLLARTAATQPSASSPDPWRLLAMAASIAFLATGWGYIRERSERAEVEQIFTQRLSDFNRLQALVRDQDSRLAAITGPSVAVLEMSSTGVNAPSARMFWDRATNRWTVFAHGLAQPKAGRAYELWLVTADKKIPAGVFKPGKDGSAVFTATYALQPGELKAVAVTEEPEAGVDVPTGAIVLLGSAGT